MARLFRDLIDLLSEDEAKTIAGPHLLRLRGCIEDGIRAVDQREAQDPGFFRVYSSSTRAALVYWQIVHLAESRFQGVAGVSTSHNRGFLTILIDDRLEIRFKKLDRTRRSRNYPTAHQTLYQQQRRLVGMEEPTRATAGYQLNPDNTVRDILVVCPRGHRLEWSFSIPMDTSTLHQHPQTVAPASDEKPVVRPKKA